MQKRALWLINHTTLRKSEIAHLKHCGYSGIYTPKSFPFDEANLSANVDFACDEGLGLSQADIDTLNAQDWYGQPSDSAWNIANRDFSTLFCALFPDQITSAIRNFNGPIILRAFGLAGTCTYDSILNSALQPHDFARLKCRAREGLFYFGAGYNNLSDIEPPWVKQSTLFLPVSLDMSPSRKPWSGHKPQVVFVCPRIATSPYYQAIYREFSQSMRGLPYVILGAQPIAVNDPHVKGYLTRGEYEDIFTSSRVMFYHSREQRHIHYHPFEAVKSGMPLIFMSGGMLDSLGGRDLPGRCKTTSEARRKIRRVLKGDHDLSQRILASQRTLLKYLEPESCRAHWSASLDAMTNQRTLSLRRSALARRKRVAVILPIAYRGGTLRAALLVAHALSIGSAQADSPADIVFAHVEDEGYANIQCDIPEGIQRRCFKWRLLNRTQADLAMRFSGHNWTAKYDNYICPDESLSDCDAWVIISDRLSAPMLPVKPTAMVVYDYIQRYVNILPHGADTPFLRAARATDRVLVTTDFTMGDALQYAGIDSKLVRKVPMIAPDFRRQTPARPPSPSYMIWTTNSAPHKNHLRALHALSQYYERGGKLRAMITGVNSNEIKTGNLPHTKDIPKFLAENRHLDKYLEWRGELDDREYQTTLSQAAFLWHPAIIDNGTFSVVEAASFCTPSLSSDYPAMREIDRQFSINITWMSCSNVESMSSQLAYMEQHHARLSALLSTNFHPDKNHISILARSYWDAVKDLL